MSPRKASPYKPRTATRSRSRQAKSVPIHAPDWVSPVRHQVDLAVLQRVVGDYSPKYNGQRLACVERTVVGPSYDAEYLRSLLAAKGLNPNLAVFVTIGKRPYGVYSSEDGYGTER